MSLIFSAKYVSMVWLELETIKNIAQSSKHKNDDELCLTEYKYSMMILIEIESVFYNVSFLPFNPRINKHLP